MKDESLNKRTSGQAFEVILKSPTDPVTGPDPRACLCRSQEGALTGRAAEKKLEAAEERRRSQEKLILKAAGLKKREHEKEVLNKAQEVNNNYSKMAEEKLIHKMEVSNENRSARLSALKQRLREK
ncbi:hypothetical protein NFI96_031683, partial [Prochilodus magdalenae]